MYNELLSRISFIHSDFEVSFDLNCFSDERFFPSLFPKWLYETHDLGFIPAPVKKSIKAVLNFVWPVLKSFPTRIPVDPGTSFNALHKVFWGDPFKKTQFYSIAARANIIEGEIYGWSFFTPYINAS